MAAPQPNALKPMNNGSTVDTKFSPKDRVKLFLNSCQEKSMCIMAIISFFSYNAAATMNSELFIVSRGRTTKQAIFVRIYNVVVLKIAADEAFGKFLIGS